MARTGSIQANRVADLTMRKTRVFPFSILTFMATARLSTMAELVAKEQI